MIKNITEITKEDADEVNIGQLLSNVNRYFSNFVDKKLADHEITRSQAQFILSLNQKDHISQEEICELFDMTEGTVARTMRRLEDKQLITREINPEDKRKKVVILTEKGKEKVKEIKKNQYDVEKKLNEKLSTKEMTSFKITLIEIMKILTEKEEGD